MTQDINKVPISTDMESDDYVFASVDGALRRVGVGKLPITDATLTESGKAADAAATGAKIDELKSDIEQLKQSGTGTGTGLSAEAINKLEEVGNYIVYTTADGGSKWTELISILRNGSSGDSGDTEKTISSISATYTGGNVATGTSLSDLTGVTITATYSDGSTKNVTGYSLSGEILEGENTITVSYSGLTTTFTVIGATESGGGTTDELPTDGLLAYFDLRNSSSSAVGTASGIPTATLGTGALFSWASQAITSADDYGAVLPRAMMFSESANETQTDLGTEFTLVILARNGIPSDTNGSNGVIAINISPYWRFKGLYNTSSGTSATDVSFDSNEDDMSDYNFLVKRVNGELMKVIFDTSSIEYVGSDYDDFVSWQSKPVIGTIYSNGSTVGCAIYNRALTDVEIEEARAFFKTLEVA